MKAMERLLEKSDYSPGALKYFLQKYLHASVKKGFEMPQHPFFHHYELFEDSLKSLILTVKKDFLLHFRDRLKSRLVQMDLRSYDDLLLDLHQALKGPESEKLMRKIRQKYQVALIDEFQDTDSVQYEIFSKIFMAGNYPVFYIGDPKQSIYQFRGADIFAYCKASRVISETKVSQNYHLDTNYRSDKGLVDAVNYIFKVRPDPFINQEIEFLPSEAYHRGSRLYLDGKPVHPFQIWFVKGEIGKKISVGEATRKIIDTCASETANLLNCKDRLLVANQPVNPEDICILVRTHLQAEQMQTALNRVNVPNVLKTTSTVYQSEEFRELLLTLEAVAEYQNPFKVKSALVTDMMGYSGDRLFELIIDDVGWEHITERFHNYLQLWLKSGVFSMVSRLMQEQEIRATYFRFENGERRLTNLLHALEVLHKAETHQKLSVFGLIKWANKSITDASLHGEEEIRLESDENSVKIMTIHNSKGLEFPIVFCPFAWKAGMSREVIFHRDDELVYDLGSDNLPNNKEQAQAEALAESIRLLYVAVTRARQKCYLIWGDINFTDHSPMTHLFHQGSLKQEEGQRSPGKDLWAEMSALCNQSNGLIQLAELPSMTKLSYSGDKLDSAELENRKFCGKISLTRKLSSYSSLTRRIEGDIGTRDFDAIAKQNDPLQDETNVADRFKIPKGSKTGIFFHEILEELDFQIEKDDRLDSLIRLKQQKFGLDEVQFTTIQEVISDTLQTDLGFGFSLSQLPMRQRISEMEFHFPVTDGHVKELIESLRRLSLNRHVSELVTTLESLDFDITKGFMKGYIDLVFAHNGRFYILDWKTNHLGNQFESYHPEKLTDYMTRHAYILQYYIYALALHKYLDGRIADYSYSVHFGGVCYLFLRGISDERKTGVYFNDMKDSEEIILLLDRFFCQPGIDQ